MDILGEMMKKKSGEEDDDDGEEEDVEEVEEVTIENVVSGPGLVSIFQTLCSLHPSLPNPDVISRFSTLLTTHNRHDDD